VPSSLTAHRIASFWFPLLGAWMLMAVEGPVISALIARLAEPKENLAAYGVAFVIALVVEAPVIMMMSCSTALVRDRDSYLKVLRYGTALNIFSTVCVALLLIPSVFDGLTMGWMGLPPEIASRVYLALVLLLPWPAAIGYRRFYQGVMIVAGETRKVMAATVLRVIAMVSACIFLSQETGLHGAAIGGAALSSGVVTEAIVVGFLARSAVKKISARQSTAQGDSTAPLTLSHFVRFYYPLALTAFLTLGIQPLVTFFVGRAVLPLESLAVLPVLHSINFFFRCFSLSYQEVILSQVGPHLEELRPLRLFAFGIGVFSTLMIGSLAFTPLATVWFVDLAGLSLDLASLAKSALVAVVLMPALSMAHSYWSSLSMHGRRTNRITIASILEVAGISFTLIGGVYWSQLSGAMLASLGLLIGRGAGTFYLWGRGHKSLVKVTE
jgi:hypothetical protein